jgi:hypothetical protein
VVSTTIRVSEDSRALAADLARRTGVPMQAVVAAALVAYEQALFWQALDEGYARLAADPEAWAGVTAERVGEAPALLDGLG